MRNSCYALLLACFPLCAADDTPQPVYTSIVITAKPIQPETDRRNSEVFDRTLFSRDDQVFHVLDAGINAGQHEGGGKSVEIRRFGFNLDHGGVSGGLKVLVDDVQQNQTTQGHGQGYLGSLKSITPELIQEVNLINGPFSAEYGDFSGLGVVHIRLRESLPDVLTARIQGGSFGSKRAFLAISPELKKADAFIAYEGSLTDGPFQEPLRYRRDNVTMNYTRRLTDEQAIGFKFNGGLNRFYSSGQVPLDAVQPFGFVDPTDGGDVRSGTAGLYYRNGGFRADGFVTRSLFDLFSNFTFYLNDPVNGDAIQQHDSRLIEGANVQYLKPTSHTLLTVGANFHDNQINVGLYPRIGRDPTGVTLRANAHVTNGAGYAQEALSYFHNKLQIGLGLRYDTFRFDVQDRVDPAASGTQYANVVQPKVSLAYTPSFSVPVTLHFNYGRGISTADARVIVQNPNNPRAATTDFFQVGTSHSVGRVSLTTDLFLIQRSNEQVYVPDDGTFEFKGPSRAYGYETKLSVKLTRRLAMNAGVTKVGNSYYRGPGPRIYVDSAPHFTANAALTLSGWKGWSGSLRMRAINHYRLDGEDPSIVASGNTVWDFGLSRRLVRGVEFNLTLDNLADRSYFETQNYFESRLAPGLPPAYRIHATPGYPLTVMAGLTFRLKGK